MPIRQINPDGTVRIYNSQSGEERDVAPGELAAYNPQLLSQYQQLAKVQQTSQSLQQPPASQSADLKPGTSPNTITGHTLQEHQQALQSAMQSGDKNAVKDITDLYNQEYQYQKDTGNIGKLKTDDTSGKITAQQMGLAKAGIQNIQKVKELYTKDPDVLTKQLIPGQFLTREWDSALYDTADSLLRLRTGAQANPSEIKGYMRKIAPSFGDDPQTVAYKLKKLEDDFKIAAGQSPDSQPISVSKTNNTNSDNMLYDAIKGNPVTNFLLGGAANVAQDIGSGIRNIQSQPNLQKQEQVAKQLEDQAYASKDPQLMKTLLGQANKIRSGVSNENQNIGQSFSKDVNDNPISRAVGAAAQIVTTAEGVANLPSLINAPKEIFRNIIPEKNAIAKAADKTGSLDTKGVIEAGENYVKNNPLAKDLWEEIKPSIAENTSGKDLLSKMFDVWKGAYTKGGDVRTNAQGQLYNKLYGAARQTIADQAPELDAAISKARFLHQAPKLMQKGSWLALKTTAIGKMLGF